MILRGKENYNSQDEATSESEETENKISEKTYPCEGELLMFQHNLDNQSSHPSKSQRENFFILILNFLIKFDLSLLIVGHVVIVVVLGWLKI